MFGKLRKIAVCSVIPIHFVLCSSNALADYQQAKSYFDNLDTDTKISITLSLIGTGDFDGLLDYGFTKRMYKAVNAFKAREGRASDGILTSSDIDRLKSKAGPFFEALGLQYYSHPITTSKLFVPRSVFDTQVTTTRGLAFERDDSNLSLSFDAYLSNEKSFLELFNSVTRVSSQRQVEYKIIRDNFFVVSGVHKGRNFYTWMSATRASSTGFTLSCSPVWATTGKKISILLANSYVAEPRVSEPENPFPPNDQQSAIDNKQKEEPPSSGTGTGFKELRALKRRMAGDDDGWVPVRRSAAPQL